MPSSLSGPKKCSLRRAVLPLEGAQLSEAARGEQRYVPRQRRGGATQGQPGLRVAMQTRVLGASACSELAILIDEVDEMTCDGRVGLRVMRTLRVAAAGPVCSYVVYARPLGEHSESP